VRTAARVDATHGEIVATLRRAGCNVLSLAAVGSGCPDLLVGAHGKLTLLEVKSEHGHLNPEQVRFKEIWGHCVRVVRTPAEALMAVFEITT